MTPFRPSSSLSPFSICQVRGISSYITNLSDKLLKKSCFVFFGSQRGCLNPYTPTPCVRACTQNPATLIMDESIIESQLPGSYMVYVTASSTQLLILTINFWKCLVLVLIFLMAMISYSMLWLYSQQDTDHIIRIVLTFDISINYSH